jgi:hypothetical protein
VGRTTTPTTAMLSQGYAIRVASSLLVALVMLAGVCAFATWRAHAGPSQASRGAARALVRSAGSGLPGATSMPATPHYSRLDGPLFRNDADGEEDGTGDAFVVIAIFALWDLLMGDGGLLLALCGGPAKPSSICSLASERPG